MHAVRITRKIVQSDGHLSTFQRRLLTPAGIIAAARTSNLREIRVDYILELLLTQFRIIQLSVLYLKL